MLKKLHALKSDPSGISVTEFGLISPAIVVMLLGTMDAGHTLYMRSVVDGAIQELARDSSLEDGQILAKREIADQRIARQIHKLHKNADVSVSRRYYRNFSQAFDAEAEDFTDTNNNGTCDNGEPFIDANLNEVWDADGADEGQGQAKDVAIVTVTVTYDRLLPMAELIGLPEQVTIGANTVLANQPWAEQQQYGAAQTRNCDD